MIEKLFESLDSKVFTDDMKQSLQESFDEAVESKAVELAEAKISEKQKELNDESKEFKASVVALAEERETKILEQVDAYLEKVVEEFIQEAKDKLDESLVNEKADLMIEAFDSMLIAGGVEVQTIVEAKDTVDVESKLTEAERKFDTLVEETIELEKQNAKLIQMGVIAEMQEDLSVVEAAKFAKLAELVEFSKDAEYASKLETIKESVKGTVAEDIVSESLNEDDKSSITKSAYAHLI